MEQKVKVYKGFSPNREFRKDMEKLALEGWRVSSQSSVYVHHGFSIRPKHLEITVVYERPDFQPH